MKRLTSTSPAFKASTGSGYPNNHAVDLETLRRQRQEALDRANFGLILTTLGAGASCMGLMLAKSRSVRTFVNELRAFNPSNRYDTPPLIRRLRHQADKIANHNLHHRLNEALAREDVVDLGRTKSRLLANVIDGTAIFGVAAGPFAMAIGGAGFIANAVRLATLPAELQVD